MTTILNKSAPIDHGLIETVADTVVDINVECVYCFTFSASTRQTGGVMGIILLLL